MFYAAVKYENLRAEMARQKLTLKQISATIHMNRDTLSRKLSGKSPLYLDEAFQIQRTFFPTIDVERLFGESASHDKAS
ncbi:helix-turn-helix transcriptional regulator [uncultured Allofournierella sp.]|uniref:helix-turn-helix domain-containing protein n=1 Tax=uncultured Allofournierella sp. TaxID=1940258 RepID=UPI0025EEBAB5|nr:helix-turn-helix transcriptional regulator [uncultured Fournierella sp.]